MTTNPAPASPQLEALLKKARSGHSCAVCPTVVGQHFLMCPPHWRLVPHAEQRAVYSTWNKFQSVTRAPGVGGARSEYFAARDRAIDSARAAMPAATGDQQ